MKQVKKRNGSIVDFEEAKITDAMRKAFAYCNVPVEEVVLETLELHEDGDLIVVHIEGSHFIWKLVRRLVGVLVEVGRGGLTEEQAAAFLTERSDLPARLTAPASGLFLERVYYPGDPRDLPVVATVVIPSS